MLNFRLIEHVPCLSIAKKIATRTHLPETKHDKAIAPFQPWRQRRCWTRIATIPIHIDGIVVTVRRLCALGMRQIIQISQSPISRQIFHRCVARMQTLTAKHFRIEYLPRKRFPVQKHWVCCIELAYDRKWKFDSMQFVVDVYWSQHRKWLVQLNYYLENSNGIASIHVNRTSEISVGHTKNAIEIYIICVDLTSETSEFGVIICKSL